MNNNTKHLLEYTTIQTNGARAPDSLTKVQVASLVEDHWGSGSSQDLCQAGQIKHRLVDHQWQ